jgi:hypothetical protein
MVINVSRCRRGGYGLAVSMVDRGANAQSVASGKKGRGPPTRTWTSGKLGRPLGEAAERSKRKRLALLQDEAFLRIQAALRGGPWDVPR